jgi:glutathione peroxidase-family protein
MKTLKVYVLLAAVGLLAAFTSKPTNDGYDVGNYATDFNLKNIDGKMVSLSNFKNAKGFIIIFTCNTCPYSIAYEDRITALDKMYKDKGFPVIAINPNDPKAIKGDDLKDMQQRAKEKGFTFPYLQELGQKIYPQYGATRTPHVYILSKDKKGNKVAYIGAIDNNFSDAAAVTERYVEDAVNSLLDNKLPKVTNTKAIGCTIKKLK